MAKAGRPPTLYTFDVGGRSISRTLRGWAKHFGLTHQALYKEARLSGNSLRDEIARRLSGDDDLKDDYARAVRSARLGFERIVRSFLRDRG